MNQLITIAIICSFLTISFSWARPRSADDCQLPDCFHSGTAIPGGLQPSEIPQIVVLNFHSSVSSQYYTYYTGLLNGRKNPNNCDIQATFFVSHDYTDYPSVNKLAAAGHEIAVNSISAETYVGEWDTQRWTDEMTGMREILNKFGLINNENVLGSQGPYIQDGGNYMFDAISQNGFNYDGTMATQYSNSPPIWPFTLDQQWTSDCGLPPCPYNTYPGFWELPIIFLLSNGTMYCSSLRSCINIKTQEDALATLKDNFLMHYNSNKAPFNIVIDPAWWGSSIYSNALTEFVNYIQTLDDVFIVTANQTLEWVKHPTTIAEISTLEAWNCDKIPTVGDCSTTYDCHYTQTDTPDGGERYARFCAPCPENYPWVGNPDGN